MRFNVLFRYSLIAFIATESLASCGGSQSPIVTPVAPPAVRSMTNAHRDFRPDLSCSPAPCAFRNVQVSMGPKPVGETPIVANPHDGNELLAAAVDQNCGKKWAGGTGGTGIYASSDGGQTWNYNCLGLAANAIATVWDPSVAYDLNGTAFASGPEATKSGLTSEDAVTESTDHGQTWSTPVAIPTIHPNAYADRMWLQVDTSPSSPRKNDLYVAENEYYGTGLGDTTMTASHSTDGGSTWTTVAVGPQFVFPTQIDGGNAVIGKDGTIYVTAWVCTFKGPTCGGTVQTNYLFKSSDGGTTWSSGTVIDKPTLAPDPCGCTGFGALPGTKTVVADIPMMAIDNSNGPRASTLYVADFSWVHNSFMQVRLLPSKDGGTTWSKRLLAPKSDRHDQFFPWVSVSKTGVIGVTWLDRRNDPKNLLYEEFGAYSADGMHFPNYQIAAKPSDPRKGYHRKCCTQGHTFIGDFTGGTWVGKKLYAAWPDTNNATDRVQDTVGGLQIP